MRYKLDAEQRERANALVATIIDDPETAAFELIWLRDILHMLNQYVADRIVVELADDESEELQTALTYASRSWAKLKTATICPSCQGIPVIRHHNGTKFECSHCDGSGLRSNAKDQAPEGLPASACSRLNLNNENDDKQHETIPRNTTTCPR